MAAAIELRADFSCDDLRRLAPDSGNAKQVRGLLALSVIFDGGTRRPSGWAGRAADRAGLVPGFNAEGLTGLIDRKTPGKAPTLRRSSGRLLTRVAEAGPEPWRDRVVRWRRIDLVQWLREEFRVSVSAATAGRELRALGSRGRPILSPAASESQGHRVSS